MRLDQELYAVYPDGWECHVRDWRRNHLLQACIRTQVPNYVDNGTTIMSRQELDNIVVALESWRRDSDGSTSRTADCWCRRLLGDDGAELLWTFEEQREQALEGLREAASHLDADTFRYREYC